MQGTLMMAILGVTVLLLALSSPLWARVDADEAQLETIRKDIDKNVTAGAEADKIQSLARQFDVSADVVQDQRVKKRGWGETTIELTMAQEFSKTDPNTYPKLTDALNHIESLRARKIGWGRIARELGFKLGPVVRAAQLARIESREGPRLAKPVTTKIEKPAKTVVRPDRYVVAERVSRPERPERAARAR